MKKFTAILCLIAMLFGMASCGKDTSTEMTPDTVDTAAESVEESTELEETRITSGLPADFDLGGKRIRVLQFHSDADVLTHALMDALLGAAAFIVIRSRKHKK